MDVASRRLIGAIAQLGPADRALLNLWVQRGMDDRAIARLSSAPSEAVAERRQALVGELAEHLGLAPADVLAALERMSRDEEPDAPQPNGARRTASGDGARADRRRAPPPRPGPKPRAHRASFDPDRAVHDPPPRGRTAEPGSPPSPVSAPPPAPDQTAPDRAAPRTHARRATPRRALLIATLLVVLATVVVVVTQSSSGGRAPSRTSASSPPPAPGQTPALPPSAASRRALRPLPGIAWHGRAAVTLTGSPGRPSLNISVTALTSLRRDHYEAWLYNSISDAVPLGKLVAPVARLHAALPTDYRRYAFVDVSLQGPRSGPNHSGQSVLRAPLP